MKRCEALKGDGTRCQARAMEGYQWCYGHHPDKAAERKANAKRGGRTGGRGRAGPADLHQIRRELRAVLNGVLRGEIKPGVGSTLFTGFGVLLRALETERRFVELGELEDRIGALEEQKEATRWGA